MNEFSGEVRRRAGHRCEYCLVPQSAFRRPLHIEHIVAKQHGGTTQLDNLALACWRCNLKKGPNLAGVEPVTGRIVPLFHPRNDHWEDHFSIRVGTLMPHGIEIRGLTAIGSVTVQVLGMNEDMSQMLRYELWIEAASGPGPPSGA